MEKEKSTNRTVISLDPAERSVLDMEGKLSTINQVINITTLLEKNLFTVHELYLGFNSLANISMISLSLNLVSNTTLVMLNLKGARFSPDKLGGLKASISCGVLKELNISSCKLGDPAALFAAAFLNTREESLAILDISDNGITTSPLSLLSTIIDNHPDDPILIKFGEETCLAGSSSDMSAIENTCY